MIGLLCFVLAARASPFVPVARRRLDGRQKGIELGDRWINRSGGPGIRPRELLAHRGRQGDGPRAGVRDRQCEAADLVEHDFADDLVVVDGRCRRSAPSAERLFLTSRPCRAG